MHNLNKFVALFLLIIFFFGVYFYTINFGPETHEEISYNEESGDGLLEDSAYKIEAFPSEEGWGYRIYFETKVLVNQPHIPAINGAIPFGTEEEAIVTGNLIIKKLRNGVFPPVITLPELDSLGINY